MDHVEETHSYDAIYILNIQSSLMPCEVWLFKKWDEMALDLKKIMLGLGVDFLIRKLPKTPLPLINFEVLLCLVVWMYHRADIDLIIWCQNFSAIFKNYLLELPCNK